MLNLPFFEETHRRLAERLAAIVRSEIEPLASDEEARDPNDAAREFIRVLAAAGLLELLVPGDAAAAAPHAGSGLPRALSVCLAREAIAAGSALADAVFAVQGLGSFPIILAGSDPIRREYLARVRTGEAIAAFAMTEPAAGSDLAAIETTARRDSDGYVLDGTKLFISNAGIADFYVVFARLSDPRHDPRGKTTLTAFVVDASAEGLTVPRSIALMAPHPIGELTLQECRVPAGARLGEEGSGLKIALSTLEFYRPTVAAAACGLAARALREAQVYAVHRRQFGSALSDLQATRFALADMHAELDAARLLVYRAAWLKDQGTPRIDREGSIAKLFATEAAQRIVDRSLQIHGARGLMKGAVIERLYREVRALRIYEGTSEIQRLIIADRVLN